MRSARIDVSERERIGDEAWLLKGFAGPGSASLLALVDAVARQAPFRRMTTPGGREMSVAMTNCGALGWISDRRGYRYVDTDPLTGRRWPPMPPAFRRLACQAAEAAGFDGFDPDACLVNRYATGARLALHQDRDEARFDAPIVSVSLGQSAVFLFGGHLRREPVRRMALVDGDVVVWGGVDRLRYHGVLPLKPAPADAGGPAGGTLPLFPGADRQGPSYVARINLTFRRAA
jgi:alkylated DNA repair protein (DNA oxidative demethylase)